MHRTSIRVEGKPQYSGDISGRNYTRLLFRPLNVLLRLIFHRRDACETNLK